MYDKPALTLGEALRMVEGAQRSARDRNVTASICIADKSGWPICVRRLDDAPPSTAFVAMARATAGASDEHHQVPWPERGRAISMDGLTIGGIGVSSSDAEKEHDLYDAAVDALVQSRRARKSATVDDWEPLID